jgi:hypothetical protein
MLTFLFTSPLLPSLLPSLPPHFFNKKINRYQIRNQHIGTGYLKAIPGKLGGWVHTLAPGVSVRPPKPYERERNERGRGEGRWKVREKIKEKSNKSNDKNK